MHALKQWTLAAVISLSAGHVAAVPMVSGRWYLFDAYADSGDAPWVDENLDALHFEVTLATDALLTVVDGGWSGGRYEVFVDGVSRGLTDVPFDAGNASKDLDFDAALADSRWSRGRFNLSAGAHTISGRAVAFGSDLLAETGGVMLTPVPEPGTWALVGVGTLLTGTALRRQRSL